MKKLTCYVCGEKKKETDFSRDNSKPGRNYRQSQCKGCKQRTRTGKMHLAAAKISAATVDFSRKTETIMGHAVSLSHRKTLRCSKCDERKVISDFPKNMGARHRWFKDYWCSECHREYQRNYEKKKRMLKLASEQVVRVKSLPIHVIKHKPIEAPKKMPSPRREMPAHLL